MYRLHTGKAMPKVSIIVPCYNMEKYIERCMNSIRKQLLEDIEIICIDDKSTDNTLSMLESYAAQDKRIHIIAQTTNMGVAIARNAGLDAATGEFVAFVDGDDYIDIDFYEKLYNGATKNGADIAKGLLVITEPDGRRWIPPTNEYVKKQKIAFCYDHTTAIFNRDFLNRNNLRFMPGITLGEDTCFVIKAAHYANQVFISPYQTAYYYIMRNISASATQILSLEKTQSVNKAINQLFDWLQNLTDISQDDYLFVTWFMFDMLIKNLIKSQKQSRYILENTISRILQETKYKKETIMNLCRVFAELFRRMERKYTVPKKFLKIIKKHNKNTYNLYTKTIFNKTKVFLKTITIVETPAYKKFYLLGLIPLWRSYNK